MKIIMPIIALLDGSNDFTTKEEEIQFQAQLELGTSNARSSPKVKSRYQKNETNNLILDIKKKIIKILFLIMNLQNDLRLTQFLTEFHKSD